MNKKRKKSSPRRSKSWEERESRDDRRDSKNDRSRSTNDPAWYSADPALLRDSASIPFSWPLGQPFDMSFHSVAIPDADNAGSHMSQVIPGIMAFKVVPTMGSGLDSDALNVAAASTYTFVRHTNAGHANYDPNDLMIYIIAMTDVYSYVNYLERIYALATCYDQRNRYLPDGLFAAMHVDGDDIKNNLADFRYRINVLINKVSALAVPATMSLFLRKAMMYAHVYCEGESIKDQLYMYYPDGFYRFGLDPIDQAGMLVYTPMDYSALLTHNDLINYGEAMYNAIWEQEDFGIMSGDILKTYGSNILTLSSLDEVVPFGPVYDPLLLHQMKNADIVTDVDRNSCNIEQNSAKSRLHQEVHSAGTTNKSYAASIEMLGGKHLLTLDAADATPEMIMECTRLKVGIKETKVAAGSYISYYACGSELVNQLTIVVWDPSSEAFNVGNILANVIFDTTLPAMFRSWAANVKAFKYAPKVCLIQDNAAHDKIIAIKDVFEVDNYGVLDNDDVKKMHTSALLNMLHVPSAAKNVKM